MDRLQEANQVASLMRRRETPKAITSVHEPATGVARHCDGSAAPICARENALRIPASRWRFTARVPDSREAFPWRPPLAAAQPQAFEMLRGVPPRVVDGMRAPRIAPPGANYLARAKKPRDYHVLPLVGAALRVSCSAGFRLPPIRSQSLAGPNPRPAALLWPDQLQAGMLPRMDFAIPSKTLSVGIPLQPMRTPRGADSRLAVALVIPCVRNVARREPRCENTPEPKCWGSQWKEPEGVVIIRMPYRWDGPAPAGFSELPRDVQRGLGDPRVALVPIAPQEGTVGPMAAHGPTPVPRSAPAHRPPPEPTAPPAPQRVAKSLIEENFIGGWHNWTAGVKDWRVDAAGAHSGSLALFKPSMEMSDYEIEFLARIEKRSVLWVFRASALEDYYLASVRPASGGGFEFTRRVVTGGVPEAAVTAPVKRLEGAHPSFTVKMRISGSRFAVWIDGQSIDRWTDDRLPSGGVGFSGTPDDRARIYWLRLSPLGDAVKESPKS
jgi:hypothetical protein